MSTSINIILKHFSKYDKEKSDFIEKVFLLENEKIDIHSPQVVSSIENELEKYIDGLFKIEKNN